MTLIGCFLSIPPYPARLQAFWLSPGQEALPPCCTNDFEMGRDKAQPITLKPQRLSIRTPPPTLKSSGGRNHVLTIRLSHLPRVLPCLHSLNGKMWGSHLYLRGWREGSVKVRNQGFQSWVWGSNRSSWEKQVAPGSPHCAGQAEDRSTASGSCRSWTAHFCE